MMMTRFVLTLLVGLVVSLETSAAFADTFACKRYTDDPHGFTTYSVFESWFPKRISLEIYDWKSRSGSKALTKEEKDRKYRLLPNGKMIAGMKPNPGFKTVDNVRYKCDRTSLQLTAGLQRKSGGAQTAAASSSATGSTRIASSSLKDSAVCVHATFFNHDSSAQEWEIAAQNQEHVQEAKRRGLSCGVGVTTQTASAPVPTTNHSNDFKETSNGKLLAYACDGYNTWTKSKHLEKYKLEAQRRGLYCDGWGFTNKEMCEKLAHEHGNHKSDLIVALQRRNFSCDKLKNQNVQIAKKSTTPSTSNWAVGISSYTNDELCIVATFRRGNKRFWVNDSFQASPSFGTMIKFLQEAKRRGLSCGVSETTQTASVQVPKAKPNVTPAALTAVEKEAERLRQELAALKAKQKQQQQTISGDSSLPTITIASASSNGPQGTISGRVTDNTGIAEVRLDGRLVRTDANGNFSESTYVPEGGVSVSIQAIDLAGLSSSMSVRLDRAAVQTAAFRFDRLNPLNRRAAKNRDAVAIIVGVSDYKETTARAAYADSDAKVFQDYAIEKLGVPRDRIKTLVNDGADEKDMLLAVKRWLARASKRDKTDVYIFFAGHGLASDDGQKMYLLPYDGAPELLEKTAILRQELFDDIASANPRSVTVFLDTCYSGTTRGTDMLIASRPIAIKALQQSVPDNFTVMTAARGDQTAKPLEEAKHGMFSYFLMKGMEGEADKNQDNKITAGELHQYVQSNVVQQSSGSQTPELQGDAERVLVRFQ